MIGTAKEVITWLLNQPQDVQFEVKRHYEKRSNNANRYFWKICSMIADVLHSSKDEIYFEALKKYGQREVISVRSDIDLTGYIDYFEAIGTGHVEGKEFTHYKVYKGSHLYDSREMSVLIDGVVEEAKALGLETLPPDEIKHLVERWGV